MTTVELPDDQWLRILEFLRSCSDLYVGEEADCRLFIEALLWMARSGAQWRLLPEHYGNWNSVYKRFARWCDRGIFKRMHHHFIDDPDMENLVIDSTIVRAHPCAAGASKKSAVKPLKLWVEAEVASALKSMWVWMPWETRCALS